MSEASRGAASKAGRRSRPEAAGEAPPAEVYHVELRQFPHNLCRFNLSERELFGTLLAPWAADRPFELGERSWDPRRAKLTVLRGPRLAPGELTMGRGWRAARRQGQDVTQEAFQAAGGVAAAGASGSPGVARHAASVSPAPSAAPTPALGPTASVAPAPPSPDVVADSLGLELLAGLGGEPVQLRHAWALAQERSGGGPASASLTLAERAVARLLRAGLVVLLLREDGGALRGVAEDEVADVLASPESWSGDAVVLRRA